MHKAMGSCSSTGGNQRITLIIDQLGAGGAERVITILANYWAAKGWDVTLLTFDHGTTEPFFDLHPAVRWQPIGIAGPTGNFVERGVRFVHRVVVLRHAIQSTDPGVVISFMDRVNVLTLVASAANPYPVIVSVHEDPERSNLGRGWRIARRLLYPRAAKIAVLTHAALAQFPTAIRRRAVIIPNPVVERDCHCDVGSPGTTKRQFHLVAMGRLERQKGFDLLLRAFASVGDAHPNWNVTIWGEGSERKALEALVDSLGLGQRVELPGHTRDVSRTLGEADLFVLSSRYEGFPMVLCEAMACGLPVVSYDCPSGPAEIIRHNVNGVLVPPEHPLDLAAALDRLMSDAGARQRLGQNAREVLDRFGVERVMTQWGEVLACCR